MTKILYYFLSLLLISPAFIQAMERSQENEGLPQAKQRLGHTTIYLEPSETNPDIYYVYDRSNDTRIKKGGFESNLQRAPFVLGEHPAFFLGDKLSRYFAFMDENDFLTMPHPNYFLEKLKNVGLHDRFVTVSGEVNDEDYLNYLVKGQTPLSLPDPKLGDDCFLYMIHDSNNHLLYLLLSEAYIKVIMYRHALIKELITSLRNNKIKTTRGQNDQELDILDQKTDDFVTMLLKNVVEDADVTNANSYFDSLRDVVSGRRAREFQEFIYCSRSSYWGIKKTVGWSFEHYMENVIYGENFQSIFTCEVQKEFFQKSVMDLVKKIIKESELANHTIDTQVFARDTVKKLLDKGRESLEKKLDDLLVK